MNKLKLITTESTPLKIVQVEGEDPVLVYSQGGIDINLDKGGSPISRLIKCSDLKEILSKYFIKGTKFIASTYNPTLYYLFPSDLFPDDPESIKFTPENNFIPTLPISDLMREEVDWFNYQNSGQEQRDLRSIKACDDWYNNPTYAKNIETLIDTRLNDIYGYYNSDIDLENESELLIGEYSIDLKDAGYSQVVNLLSNTSYTDTINLEDWVLGSKKGTYPISGKLDISYMYSYGGSMYAGMQTIKAFQYEENVISKNIIINQGEGCPVQIEYMNNILKIYPLYDLVDEVVFTDCTLTIGVLYE